MFPLLHLLRRRQQPPRKHHRLGLGAIPGAIWGRGQQARYFPLCLCHAAPSTVSGALRGTLNPNKDSLIVTEWLTLTGIPQGCFQYKLGNRSALEWVIDQYQVSTDTRSGITSDPNRLDDERYIVQLLGKVVTVSMGTVQLVEELAQAVQQEAWMGEIATVE